MPWLEGKAANTYTQFGEDGLIDAVFERIGTTTRQCFEVGAADGLFFSNTLRLREQGWSAVLIEKDIGRWQKLHDAYSSEQVQCLLGTVTDLDRALRFSQYRHEKRPDLGVIDVDGQDYWLWLGMIDYRPRVMLVETDPSDWQAIPPRNEPGQAGLAAIKQVGTSKGYTLVAHTYCNALFVDSAVLAEL